MKRIRISAAILFVTFLPAILSAADRTDEAITRIDAVLIKAISEVQTLTQGVTNIRTPAEAVVSLDRFASVVTRMQNELKQISDEFSGSVDAKTLLGKSSGFRQRMQPAGRAYGQAIGRLPAAILNSDDFRSAYDKLRKLGLAQ